jgi:hypothetical protein
MSAKDVVAWEGRLCDEANVVKNFLFLADLTRSVAISRQKFCSDDRYTHEVSAVLGWPSDVFLLFAKAAGKHSIDAISRQNGLYSR